MKLLFTLLLLSAISFQSQAKIWRINNIAGVNANFTTVYDAVNSASVQHGDTLYLEPSPADYNTGSTDLTKRLTFMGPGYLLDPLNGTTPGNTGLQVSTNESRMQFYRLTAASTGSKFIGVTIAGAIYLNNTGNITFEKVRFLTSVYFEDGTVNGITIRKCFFDNGSNINNAPPVVITNFTCENSIFAFGSYAILSQLSGSANLFRNNSLGISGNTIDLENCYIANNIFGSSGVYVFTNSTVKNNLFQTNPTLPGTATGNLVDQDMTSVYRGGTGSFDSRFQLQSPSPAAGKGLTVGSVVNPDCGAFGGTDPYVLSGIPNIPAIYTLTVPSSIPSGTATMNVTFSSKNHN